MCRTPTHGASEPSPFPRSGLVSSAAACAWRKRKRFSQFHLEYFYWHRLTILFPFTEYKTITLNWLPNLILFNFLFYKIIVFNCLHSIVLHNNFKFLIMQHGSTFLNISLKHLHPWVPITTRLKVSRWRVHPAPTCESLRERGA